MTTDRLPDIHGMLMVLGFVGTVISLERSVAWGRWYGYLAPAASGSAVALLLSPAPLVVGQWLLVLGAAGLVAVYLPLWRRQRDQAVLTQALGALFAAGAALLWVAGVPVPRLVTWLAAFVVLTIGGERLELARLSMGPRAGATLVSLAGALTCGAVASLVWPSVGTALFGIALLSTTLWLASNDVARSTVNSSGPPRYMAVCMLAGYAWLAVAGGIWTIAGSVTDGGAYDAVLHALFLGFTISMIMAHAPIILPAVVRRPLPYHPVMFVPLALLHASLVLRTLVGDAYGIEWAWQYGGVFNIVAVAGFVGVALWSAGRGVPACRTRPERTQS